MPKALDPRERLLLIAYVTAAFLAAAIRLAAWRYAAWHDPWLTPRHTYSMRLWWGVGGALFELNILGAAAGALLLTLEPNLRRRSILWFAVAALAASVGLPGPS